MKIVVHLYVFNMGMGLLTIFRQTRGQPWVCSRSDISTEQNRKVIECTAAPIQGEWTQVVFQGSARQKPVVYLFRDEERLVERTFIIGRVR